jgi:hypothetical protein
VSFWSPLWVSRLTRDARWPGGRVVLALGGPTWLGDVNRSHAIAHRRAEDHPLAKVTYFRVVCAILSRVQ